MSGKPWSFSNTRLNLAGFRQLRTSDGAKQLVNGAADKIAAEASRQSGEAYVANGSPGKRRARAVVGPDSFEAAVDSAANLTLLKSMDAGRS